MRNVLHWVKREPSAVLLLVQLLSVLAFPFLEETHAGRAAFSALAILVLTLAVRAVNSSPAWLWVSIVLAVPAAVLLVLQAISGDTIIPELTELLLAALYFYTAGALLTYMLRDRSITRDELYAVGATFTLVAWAFAHLFTWCQAVFPGSFTAALQPEAQRSWMELLFLSFTTLSSTGLSDVVPVLPFARALVMMEQVAGVGYIAMVVSRLVTLQAARDAPHEDQTGAHDRSD
jgi:hypothetical protein